MDEVKSHFPARTLFEEYWPSKGLLEALPPTAAASSAGHKRSHSRLPSSAAAAVPAWTRRQSSAEMVAVMPASVMAAAASSASGAATVTAKERGSKGNGYVHMEVVLSDLHLFFAAPPSYPGTLGASPTSSTPSPPPQPQQLRRIEHKQQQPQLLPPPQPQLPKLALAQVKEFDLPVPPGLDWKEPFSPEQLKFLSRQSYRIQKSLIDQKLVQCLNLRPNQFTTDLILSLPDVMRTLGFSSGSGPAGALDAKDILRTGSELKQKFGFVMYKANRCGDAFFCDK